MRSGDLTRAAGHGASYGLRMEYDDPGSRVLVAVDTVTGEIVGMATAGVSRDPNPPTAWELYSVNLVAEARGSGLADDVLDAVIEARPTSVWVVVDNARARAFYRRRGFSPDGATRHGETTGETEIRLVRPGRRDDA